MPDYVHHFAVIRCEMRPESSSSAYQLGTCLGWPRRKSCSQLTQLKANPSQIAKSCECVCATKSAKSNSRRSPQSSCSSSSTGCLDTCSRQVRKEAKGTHTHTQPVPSVSGHLTAVALICVITLSLSLFPFPFPAHSHLSCKQFSSFRQLVQTASNRLKLCK